MRSRKAEFRQVRLSLSDMVGEEYVDAVCRARTAAAGGRIEGLLRAAKKEVDFFPRSFQRRIVALLPRVGEAVTAPLRESASGASSDEFTKRSKTGPAPLTGWGPYRVGEDGRLYFATKAEHYHAPLGHAFPGYGLLAVAGRLGIPNPTHNNTRGHITRLLEGELVRAASGVAPGDEAAMARIIRSRSGTVLNRVLNLQTGSLACEAAIKLLLGRFYRVQDDSPKPVYEGRTPVMLVLGDDDGALQANYHGTTVLAQMMRGMWPQLLDTLAGQGAMLVHPVRPNSLEELEVAFAKYEKGRYKIAGFFYELVMMNYGARRLTEAFVRRIHRLCRKHDVPAVADEIQTCVWSPEMFMYREYGVTPAVVLVGKGLPGGQYAASRILFSSTLDALPQFGALVTNGQEELSSLAYLITMRWAQANAQVTSAVGQYYEERLRELAQRHREHIRMIDGRRHLASICFERLEPALAFVKALNEAGLDISVQTYKADCPPAALTKLPITAGYEVVDGVLAEMESALVSL